MIVNLLTVIFGIVNRPYGCKIKVMAIIQLMLNLTDDLRIKNIIYEYNDTNLPSNSETLGNIAVAILRSLKLNKDSLVVQDLLIELNIDLSKS